MRKIIGDLLLFTIGLFFVLGLSVMTITEYSFSGYMSNPLTAFSTIILVLVPFLPSLFAMTIHAEPTTLIALNILVSFFYIAILLFRYERGMKNVQH